VAEQDDLAVNTVKIVEGHPEAVLQLCPQRLGRWGERRVAKLGGEVERGSAG